MTLSRLLRSKAAETPNTAVLYCGDQTMSWDELDGSTSELARWFLTQGLRKGDRVAIHWANCIEVVQLFFGVFKAGLVAVPVNVRLKAAEIAFILQHSEARMCFSEPALKPRATEAGAQCVIAGLPRLQPSAGALPDIDPDEPAVIMYTSGTTARPKGVIHTHRTLLANSMVVVRDRLDTSDRILVPTQLMHASGLYCDLLPALCCGGAAVLLPSWNPSAVLDAIERFRCTYTLFLPAMLHELADEQARQRRDLRCIRWLLAGGDSVPVNLQDRVQNLFGTSVQEGYGMTEAVALILNPKGAIRRGSLGLPLPEIDVRIVDVQDCDIAEGATGEIAVRGSANCVGYWNDPEATDRLLRGGWLHTGDLGSCDRDGYYWFKGRAKQMIIRGGSNVSPQEVEEALYAHPAISEAGVIGTPDPVLGERILAFVSLASTETVSEDELREFARQRLADYKVPERIVFLPEMPKGPTGKVQRRALKEMLAADPYLLEQRAIAKV